MTVFCNLATQLGNKAKERVAEMKNFNGKVAVITGAASGIGKGLAARCVREGMNVVLADIEEEALNQAASELQAVGAGVLAVKTDVSNAESVKQLAQAAIRHFGAVHLLFNNAGVAADSWVWQNTLHDWEWVLGVNLWGVIHGIRTFVPLMVEQATEGHIINTASMVGLIATSGLGAYAATKHAVVSLSETLYLELAQIKAKIGVSVLCPLGVQTKILESARNRPASKAETAATNGTGPFDTELGQKFWQRVWQEALTPDQLADLVFDAIQENRFYILSDPAATAMVEQRMNDILEGRNPSNAMSIFAA